jgi:hypothetical protein
MEIGIIQFENSDFISVRNKMNGIIYIAMKPFVEAMGLSWKSQMIKLKGDSRFELTEIEYPTNGGHQFMLSLNVDYLPAYLYSINPNKLHIDLKSKIELFQLRTFEVINRYWRNQTPKTAHQTVQTQNETLDLDFYTQQSEKIFKLVEIINSKSIKTLYFADNLYKKLNLQSPLELLKIDLENYYFIPTELGNFINTTAIEINKILEAKNLQTKENGAWNLTEKGRNFAIEVQNGSFLQIKWKLKAIFE